MKKAIDHLKKVVQNAPNYVQMICFHLVAAGYQKIGHSEVEAILKKVVRQNAYAYKLF